MLIVSEPGLYNLSKRSNKPGPQDRSSGRGAGHVGERNIDFDRYPALLRERAQPLCVCQASPKRGAVLCRQSDKSYLVSS
jgi:hypothetical protein